MSVTRFIQKILTFLFRANDIVWPSSVFSWFSAIFESIHWFSSLTKEYFGTLKRRESMVTLTVLVFKSHPTNIGGFFCSQIKKSRDAFFPQLFPLDFKQSWFAKSTVNLLSGKSSVIFFLIIFSFSEFFSAMIVRQLLERTISHFKFLSLSS